MANGNMAEQIRLILEQNADIPQVVTNKLIMMTIIESHKSREDRFEQVDRRFEDVETMISSNSDEIGLVKQDVTELKESQSVFVAKTEQSNKNNITFEYIWDKFGLPLLMVIVTVLISTFIATNYPK